MHGYCYCVCLSKFHTIFEPIFPDDALHWLSRPPERLEGVVSGGASDRAQDPPVGQGARATARDTLINLGKPRKERVRTSGERYNSSAPLKQNGHKRC